MPYNPYINLYAKTLEYYIFSVSRKSNLHILCPIFLYECEDNNLFPYRGPDCLVKQFALDLWRQEDKEGFIQLL